MNISSVTFRICHLQLSQSFFKAKSLDISWIKCLFQEGDIELEVVFVTPDEDSDDDSEVIGLVEGRP